MGAESWTPSSAGWFWWSCHLSASPCAIALQVAWQGSGGNEKFFFDNENVSRMGQNAPHECCVKLCVHQQEKCHLCFWKTLFLSSFLDLASSCRSQSASSLYSPFPPSRYKTNSVCGLTRYISHDPEGERSNKRTMARDTVYSLTPAGLRGPQLKCPALRKSCQSQEDKNSSLVIPEYSNFRFVCSRVLSCTPCWRV